MQPNQPPANQPPNVINQPDNNPQTTAAAAVPITAVTNTQAQAATTSVITSTQQQQQRQLQHQAQYEEALHQQQQALRRAQLELFGVQARPSVIMPNPNAAPRLPPQVQAPFIPPTPPAADTSNLSLLAAAAALAAPPLQQQAVRAEPHIMRSPLRAARAAPYPLPIRPQVITPAARAITRPALDAASGISPVQQTAAITELQRQELNEFNLELLPQPVADIPATSAYVRVGEANISVLQLALNNQGLAASTYHAQLNPSGLTTLITHINQAQNHLNRFRLMALFYHLAGVSDSGTAKHFKVQRSTVISWATSFMTAYNNAITQGASEAQAINAAVLQVISIPTNRLQLTIESSLRTTQPRQATVVTQELLQQLNMQSNLIGMELTNPNDLTQSVNGPSAESIHIGGHQLPINNVTLQLGQQLGFSTLMVQGHQPQRAFHPSFGQTQLNQLVIKANEARGKHRLRLFVLVMLATGNSCSEITQYFGFKDINSIQKIRLAFEQALNNCDENLTDITPATDTMIRIVITPTRRRVSYAAPRYEAAAADDE